MSCYLLLSSLVCWGIIWSFSLSISGLLFCAFASWWGKEFGRGAELLRLRASLTHTGCFRAFSEGATMMLDDVYERHDWLVFRSIVWHVWFGLWPWKIGWMIPLFGLDGNAVLLDWAGSCFERREGLSRVILKSCCFPDETGQSCGCLCVINTM